MTEGAIDSSPDVMIEAAQLRKMYGRFAAVDGVSFRVRRGEVVAFLGPNGAGKSTTMKMLTGCLTPTSGAARLAGIEPAAPCFSQGFLFFCVALFFLPSRPVRRRGDGALNKCDLKNKKAARRRP